MGEGIRRAALLAAIGFALGACGGPTSLVGGHTPHPTYKVGSPYTMKGVTYYPRVDYAYDETGMASWYGGSLQGQYTANGELFDVNELTAAHTTLPLPSIVEVENLENGRALHIRVNDRGPFASGRIIDLSRRAAQLLGFERRGTARVRVTILKDESMRAAALAQRGIISDAEEQVSTIPETHDNAVQAAAASGSRFYIEAPQYHVEVGPVASRDEANRLRQQMIDSGYRDAHVVID